MSEQMQTPERQNKIPLYDSSMRYAHALRGIFPDTSIMYVDHNTPEQQANGKCDVLSLRASGRELQLHLNEVGEATYMLKPFGVRDEAELTEVLALQMDKDDSHAYLTRDEDGGLIAQVPFGNLGETLDTEVLGMKFFGTESPNVGIVSLFEQSKIQQTG